MGNDLRRAALYAAAALVLASAGHARAQETACISCHRQLMTGRTIHEAMQARMGCRICHSGILERVMPHKSSTAIGRGLTARVPELCWSCHEKKAFTRPVVHGALEKGCLGCHVPHASEHERLLNAPQPELCTRCHARTLIAGQHRHGALEMGCTTCHDPHASENEKLLRTRQPDICYGCHDRGLFARRDVHGALGMGCTGCHGAHTTENKKLLVLPVPEVCFACHTRIAYSGQNVHGPAAAGLCMACHLPHSADQDGLLVTSPAGGLCVSCHDGFPEGRHAVSSPSAGAGESRADAVRTRKREDDRPQSEGTTVCGACHDPHSRGSRYLLRTLAGQTIVK
ncbi:MAG: cytochrome c3 family protein [Nitrospirota bacterium]